jgi:hypothetical protein
MGSASGASPNSYNSPAGGTTPTRLRVPRSASKAPAGLSNSNEKEKGDPLLVMCVVRIVDGKETNARNLSVRN